MSRRRRRRSGSLNNVEADLGAEAVWTGRAERASRDLDPRRLRCNCACARLLWVL